MKRTATNSMIATAKRCRKKFVWRYVEGLVPARGAKAPGFGSLFHLLVRRLLVRGLDVDFDTAVNLWRVEKIESAVEHAEQVRRKFGFEDAGIIAKAEEDCSSISREATELAAYYRDSVLRPEEGRYRVLWTEQRFSVPLTDRKDRRHKTWRFDGKWDAVLQDRATGRTVIRDFKTTTRSPLEFAELAELDTQPVGYLYAGLYLQTCERPLLTRCEVKRDGAPDIGDDAPYWPSDVGAPKGFELEIIRRKVPKEPPLLKTGRLSKKKGIDTTAELFRRAIDRHKLAPADYADVLSRLERRGPAFHLRTQVGVDVNKIVRWAEETRQCLEDLRVLELHPERAYRADPGTCTNQYGRKCEYHALCYGDEGLARADFVRRPIHAELLDEGGDNG